MIRHPPNFSGACVYNEALRGQISVQESSKDHDLGFVDGIGAELAALGITAGTCQVNVLPVSCSIEIVRACKI